jgi:hypothetical protein
MKSLMPLYVISVLPRNWKPDSMFRYSPPNLNVCAPRVHVSASLNEIERGSKIEPVVDALLVARIKRPLRAMPVVPRASMEDDVTVPDSDTPAGSYPDVAPTALALVSGAL